MGMNRKQIVLDFLGVIPISHSLRTSTTNTLQIPPVDSNAMESGKMIIGLNGLDRESLVTCFSKIGLLNGNVSNSGHSAIQVGLVATKSNTLGFNHYLKNGLGTQIVMTILNGKQYGGYMNPNLLMVVAEPQGTS